MNGNILCASCHSWRELRSDDQGPMYCGMCGQFVAVAIDETFLVCGFQTGEGEEKLKAAQDRVCYALEVSATAFKQNDVPPYVATIYLKDPENPAFAGGIGISAGTVYRAAEDRWPTVQEIELALVHWRGGSKTSPKFCVVWHEENSDG